MNASVLGSLRSRGHQTLCASLEMCTDPPLRVPPLDRPSIPPWARAHLLPRSHTIQSPLGELV